MIRYYFWLSLKSIKSNPWLSGLMVVAIALGIGAFMTTYTIFHYMSGDPIPHKSDKLFVVQLDNWEESGWDTDADLLPPHLTYRDARFLAEADQADYQTAMFTVVKAVRPQDPEIKPFRVSGLMTYSDFFPMFEPEFLYGSSWTREDDKNRSNVIVISRKLNDRIFGGQDSTGKYFQLGGNDYRVVGVLKDFEPRPKYYDLINSDTFDDSEDFYLPFTLNDILKQRPAGNNSCWKAAPNPSYEGYLESECIWVGLWVQLNDNQKKQDYQQFIDNYVTEQKKLGRFPRPLDNRLTDVMDWLEVRNVVTDDTHIQLWLSSTFLIVCLLNTVGLMLAKFLKSAGNVGVRRALGASRVQIFYQHIAESALLGFAGALLGLLFAWLGLSIIRSLTPDIAVLTQLDTTLTLFAFTVAIISSLLAGIYPTWRICQIAPARQLKSQ